MTSFNENGAEGIACWFIDTDYNEESFFVRHAYFLGAGDSYKSLKTGRIAVKVINHLGDEVMKVFRVT